MSISHDITNPSTQPAPAIDCARRHLAGKHSTKSVAGVTLTMPPDHDIVEIKGMSMAPELRDGMMALVDRRHRIPSPPAIYMVDFGAGEFPAYVESLVGRERIVRVWFADPHHGRFEMSPDELTLLGRIVCIFQPV